LFGKKVIKRGRKKAPEKKKPRNEGDRVGGGEGDAGEERKLRYAVSLGKEQKRRG